AAHGARRRGPGALRRFARAPSRARRAGAPRHAPRPRAAARARAADGRVNVAAAPAGPMSTGSFSAGFAWSFARDLTLAMRHPGETLLVVAFFVLVASLFPLGVGAEPQLLLRIGPGVIWVGALVAAFLSLP